MSNTNKIRSNKRFVFFLSLFLSIILFVLLFYSESFSPNSFLELFFNLFVALLVGISLAFGVFLTFKSKKRKENLMRISWHFVFFMGTIYLTEPFDSFIVINVLHSLTLSIFFTAMFIFYFKKEKRNSFFE